ncbi:MAG: bacteriohemerythrin [Phyllobacteriaceae bacterium]|nr:bacteriohemerythrin [Phyllobacteriaceae bacterium]
MHPALPLGVPEMDADHAALEAMLDRVPHTRDEDLPALYAAIEAEVTSHFAREDVLMEAARVPVLDCHRIRHRELLDAIAARRPTERTSPDALRRTFAELAEAVTAHVDTVDRVTSRFLIAATAAPLEPAQAVG